MLETNKYTDQAISAEIGLEEGYQPKIFSTKGRIGRMRFLTYGMPYRILALLSLFLLTITDEAMEKAKAEEFGFLLINLFALVLFVVALVFSLIFLKRRLNDLNKTGWLCLLGPIPVVGFFVGIYALFFKGTDGPNKYGPPPVKNSFIVRMLGLSCIVTIVIVLVMGVSYMAIVRNRGITAIREEMEKKRIHFEESVGNRGMVI